MTILFGGFVILQPKLQNSVLAEDEKRREIEISTTTDETSSRQPENEAQITDNGEEAAPSDTAMSETTKNTLGAIAACVFVICNPYGIFVLTGILAIVRIGAVIDSILKSPSDSGSLSGSPPNELEWIPEKG